MGQELKFTVYARGPTLAIEYYEHDDMPMGMLEAIVHCNSSGVHDDEHAGTTCRTRVTMLDGRCLDCLKHQGFYKFKTIAEGLPTGQATTVGLKTVPRPDGREGSKFCLVSLVSY